MHLDPDVINDLTDTITVDRWLRVMPARHMRTPLGRGFGLSRWSSPKNSFKVIYLGQEIETSIAETIVRDRFEAVSASDRELKLSEIMIWGIAEIQSKAPLRVLDLTGSGAFRLGVDTDAVGAKHHKAGQDFSEILHDEFARIDGIMYPSRLTRGRCIAVYDRSIDRCLGAGHAIGLERVPDLAKILNGLSVALIDDLP